MSDASREEQGVSARIPVSKKPRIKSWPLLEVHTKFALRLSEAGGSLMMLPGEIVRGKVCVNGVGMCTSARLSGGRRNGA